MKIKDKIELSKIKLTVKPTGRITLGFIGRITIGSTRKM